MWNIHLLLAIIALIAPASGSITAQTSAIPELKEKLGNQLTEEYMKENYWLERWLIQKEYNVEEAVPLITEYLQFRSEQNAATILNEDWSDIRAKFPYSRNTTDKTGRPILYIDTADWDIASYFGEDGDFTELHNRKLRYLVMLHEEAEAELRQLRSEGKDVTQYIYIVNFGGYSVSRNMCVKCMYSGSLFSKTLTPIFRASVKEVVLVNVPYIFKAMFNMYGSDTRSFISLYGQDQEQWETKLLESIDLDQLPRGILAEVEQKDNSEGFLLWKNQEL